MKKFRVSCKDQITELEMILSECSFNEACAFLEEQNLGKYLGMEAKAPDVSSIAFEKRKFLYDEARGYLMGY